MTQARIVATDIGTLLYAHPRERVGRLDPRDNAAVLEDALKDTLLDAGILANIYLLGVRTRDLYAGVQPQRGALDDATARQ